MSNTFRFKQFSVHQDRSAMKVGTDGVLLGAWVDLAHNPTSILDIGAGTGVIALMMAQRSTAELIDAVEVNDQAYVEAVENFERSPWGDRLFCYHADFREFYEEIEEVYDLIVSNPPFFRASPSGEPIAQGRCQARFNSHLPFEELIMGASRLLSPRGKLAVIVPFAEEDRLIAQAAANGLYLESALRVRGRDSAPVKRSLLLFGRTEKEPKRAELTIEIARHQYTGEYQKLTADFYLD